MGRGGAAFPTGRKWAAVAAQAAQPHYLVCNADESEPGTFKDRVLLEGDPFATVEAMTIAAYATGASKGYLYIRGEYPEAEARVANAIDRAREAGLLGDDILGSGFAFDIELRRGAGAYICGEETALFESIEGKRGEPRNKPPFPVEVGLFGKPTVVNNVETLANVLRIVTDGGEAFARIGTEGSTGPKLFCLSGHVERPGVYEVEFGATLRDLIEMAGGVPGGREIRTILLGGAAGVFVGPSALDMPLTFEATRAHGATLGSGVIMVFDETADLVDTLRRIAQFFRDESCGQCVPCRVGTVRQEELLARLAAGSQVRTRGRGGGAPARDRAGDARRVDLRPRPDRIVGDRVCPAPAGYGGAVSDGLSMDRDPAPDARTPHAGQDSAAQPLTDILLTPPARASKPPTAPVVEAPPAVSLTIDGVEVTVPAGTTILGACRTQGIDTPTLCYAENLTPVNVCRVCVVEVTGSRVLVPACSRPVEAGMDVQTDSERVRLSRKMVLEFLGSSVDLSLAGPIAPDGSIAAYAERYGADADALRTPGRPGAGRRTRHARGRPSPRARRRRHGRHRRPADEGRQQPLRPRLLEVHPLLQVRRRLRRGGPEHLRDRRRRARLRCADLDRAGRPAPRVGVRLLRQLHRRLPDRRADVQVRVRHARGRDLGRVGPDRDRDDLPVLRRRLRRRAPRPGRPHRQGHLADGLLGHRRPPLHQGPLRLRVRQQPPDRAAPLSVERGRVASDVVERVDLVRSPGRRVADRRPRDRSGGHA